MGGEEHARGVRTDYAKREAAKHVESFGVGFWIRVQFPAPPPTNIADLRLLIADLITQLTQNTNRQLEIGNWP